MAISIRHRFIERLIPSPDRFKIINTIVIGTFNPGLPDKSKLSASERETFSIIEMSTKFQNFNSVRNFYDRHSNRFWGIMDRIYNSEFYEINGSDTKNYNGLKYYVGSDRAEVFARQQNFCEQEGIFLTDFVTEIKPTSFENIYDNFPDTQVEISNPIWNTDMIIETINNFQPKRVLINFGINNKSIPKISEQAKRIQNSFSTITTSVISTSGNAAYDYPTLVEDWKQHFFIKSPNF